MEDRTNTFMTTYAAAKMLRLSPRTLENYRYERIGPRYFKSGSRVLYKESDILNWIEQFAITPMENRP